MIKRLLILCGLMTLAVPGFGALNVVQPVYDSPHVWKQSPAGLVVKASFDVGSAGDFHATFDGKPVDMTVEKTKAVVWLPLMGKDGILKITSDKGVSVVDQVYTPLIDNDWGYFAGGTIHIICSSHQDIAWMNTPDTCREERIHKIIAPALDMMKTDKKFAFDMEQTLNLMEFLDAYPDRKQEVIDRYKEGRFTWGATFVQPYEGMESGEMLVRQAYFGRKWIKENLPGCDEHTAYNMDVPGRTWQMPQILAKSGIKNLFISRMREGMYDWYSPDGSKIFTFTPGNYGWDVVFWRFFDDDAITALHKLQERAKYWSAYYKEHNIPPDYAVVVSNDAAGPTNYSKVVDEWNKIAAMAGGKLPKLKHSSAEEYFNAVNVPSAKPEVVKGERPDLWLYIHGPAHYEAISAMRRASVLLPAAESFSTFDALLKNSFDKYPAKELSDAWMSVIYPDHGWGGLHGEITDSIFREKYNYAEKVGREKLNSALTDIAAQTSAAQNAILVFNDLGWTRDDVARIAMPAGMKAQDYMVADENGTAVASQVSGDDLVVWATNIPAMGYRTFYLKKRTATPAQTAASAPAVVVTANSVDNRFYRIVLGNGGIVEMFDKELGRNVIRTDRFAAGDILSMSYEGNGAGEFDQITPINVMGLTEITSTGQLNPRLTPLKNGSMWKVTEDGPLFTTFEARSKQKFNSLVQRVRVYHVTKKVDFDVVVENFTGEHNRQFRIALPVDMDKDKFVINYEVPMGVMQVGRDEMKGSPGGWGWFGTYRQEPSEINPREVMNFISANGQGFGVTMSSCVAVADWIDPTRESADYPVLQGILLSSHKSCHGLGNWYEQKGTHSFSFSVTSHKEGWENGYHFGVAANHPMHVVVKQSKDKGKLPASMSFASISDPMVNFSTIKKADNSNDVIVRFVDMKGRDGNVTLNFWKPIGSAIATNLVEEPGKDAPVAGGKLNVDVGHNSIETYKLKF